MLLNNGKAIGPLHQSIQPVHGGNDASLRPNPPPPLAVPGLFAYQSRIYPRICKALTPGALNSPHKHIVVSTLLLQGPYTFRWVVRGQVRTVA